jgi:hypothetical protein
MFYMNKPTLFRHLLFNLHISKLTLLLLTALEQISFHKQLCFVGLILQLQFKLKMAFIAIDTQWISFSL